MLYPSNSKTEEELLQVIEETVYYYNFKKFQKRLNQCTPIDYRVTQEHVRFDKGGSLQRGFPTLLIYYFFAPSIRATYIEILNS